MLKLKDFKVVKIERENLSMLSGGDETEYSQHPVTGSTYDIITATYYEDYNGRVYFS